MTLIVLKGGHLHVTLKDGRSSMVPCPEHTSGYQKRTDKAVQRAIAMAQKKRIPLKPRSKSA